MPAVGATAPVVKCEDVSLFDFVERRLGEDVANYAVDPLVRGICAGDARSVSVNFHTIVKPGGGR